MELPTPETWVIDEDVIHRATLDHHFRQHTLKNPATIHNDSLNFCIFDNCWNGSLNRGHEYLDSRIELTRNAWRKVKVMLYGKESI